MKNLLLYWFKEQASKFIRKELISTGGADKCDFGWTGKFEKTKK